MAKNGTNDCMCIHADEKCCTNSECSERNPQPIINFHKNRNSPDGYINHCKSCRKIYITLYRATQAYKNSQDKYKQSELGKISNRARGKRYRNSGKGKRRSQRYWHEYKGNSENSGKLQARAAVSSAVSLGKFPHILSLVCTFCLSKAQNYHHHSYDEKYHLSVIPVCLFCHRRLHEIDL